MVDLLLAFAALSVAIVGTIGEKRTDGRLNRLGKGAIALAIAIFLLSTYKALADAADRDAQAKDKRYAQQVGHREVALAVGRLMDETFLDPIARKATPTAKSLQNLASVLKGYNVKELAEAAGPAEARLHSAVQAFGHYLLPGVLAESQELLNHSFLLMLELGRKRPDQTLEDSGFSSEEYDGFRSTGEGIVCRIATDRRLFTYQTIVIDQSVFDQYIAPITTKRSKLRADGTWSSDPVTLTEYLNGRSDLRAILRDGKFVETCKAADCDSIFVSKDLSECSRLLQ